MILRTHSPALSVVGSLSKFSLISLFPPLEMALITKLLTAIKLLITI
jgi:hypothetical protein